MGNLLEMNVTFFCGDSDFLVDQFWRNFGNLLKIYISYVIACLNTSEIYWLCLVMFGLGYLLVILRQHFFNSLTCSTFYLFSLIVAPPFIDLII